MKYLLDVNALLALAFEKHEFHQRTSFWLRAERTAEKTAFLSCPIIELGFVRIASTLPIFQTDLHEALHALAQLKAKLKISLITDDHGAERLPKWVKTGKQTTDGHLTELAKAHGAKLATLDGKIPGAFVIPKAA